MKRTVLLIAAFICFAVAINAQKTYAIVMGVQDYDNPSFSLSNLHNTARDAKEMRKVLKKAGVEVALLTGKNVNRSTFNKKLQQLTQLVNQNSMQDNVIIFFSGHGDDYALCFWDGLYKYAEMFSLLNNMKAKNIFIFIDACHSGSGGTVITNNAGSVNPRMSFVSATRPSESSIDDPFNEICQGWFTQAMIKGIRGGSDTNRDRVITLIELFKYIYNDVTARASHYRGLSEGVLKVFHPQLYAPSSMHGEAVVRW